MLLALRRTAPRAPIVFVGWSRRGKLSISEQIVSAAHQHAVEVIDLASLVQRLDEARVLAIGGPPSGMAARGGSEARRTVQTLYDPQVPLDKAPNGIYSKADRAKLDWAIKLTDDGKLECPDECYAAWPQLRMAGQMLKQLPAESGQRKMFEGQVNTAATSLAKTKETFKAKLDGAVSAAHNGTYRPLYAEDEEKLAYFDAIAAARPYVTLQANYSTEEGEEVLLPPIKIVIK